MTDWKSAHVFLSDPARCEAFLLDVAIPLSQSLISRKRCEKSFFIRYWEGGYHLRLRYAGLQESHFQDLRRELRAAATEYRNPSPPSREDYYARQGFVDSPSGLPWFEEGSVVGIDYEPEVARYGGPDGIGPNEDMFCLSSALAARVCEATRADFARRLTVGADLMMAGAIAIAPEPNSLELYFSVYAERWKAFADPGLVSDGVAHARAAHFASRLAALLGTSNRETDGGRGAGRVWTNASAELASRLRTFGREGRLISPTTGTPAAGGEIESAIAGIVASQMHMLNNRLAISPGHEHALALLIAAGGRHLPSSADATMGPP